MSRTGSSPRDADGEKGRDPSAHLDVLDPRSRSRAAAARPGDDALRPDGAVNSFSICRGSSRLA